MNWKFPSPILVFTQSYRILSVLLFYPLMGKLSIIAAMSLSCIYSSLPGIIFFRMNSYMALIYIINFGGSVTLWLKQTNKRKHDLILISNVSVLWPVATIFEAASSLMKRNKKTSKARKEFEVKRQYTWHFWLLVSINSHRWYWEGLGGRETVLHIVQILLIHINGCWDA